MKAILDFFTGPLNNIAWLYIFLPCVAVGGLLLTIRTGAVQFRHFHYAMAYQGKIITKNSSASSAGRYLPNAFVISKPSR